MLCTILTVGLVFIFFDVTLIQLLLIMGILVIIMVFALGIVTMAEIRAKFALMKTSGILKRLDGMKFFEKHAAPKDTKAPRKTDAPVKKPAKAESAKTPGGKTGFGARITSLFAPVGTLKNIIRLKFAKGKKVEDINKMLDKTVNEKVTRTTSTSASSTVAGGAGGMAATPPGGAEDPFLSLSGDEFDSSLLDGLDDDSPPEMPEEITPDSGLPAPELSMPSMEEMAASAGAPPSDSASSLDEFSGLEGDSSLDAEFGDLDNINLDDVEMDDDMGDVPDAAGTAPDTAEATSATGRGAPATAPPTDNTVKTAWIPSDAPPSAENPNDQLGMQSDMASFAGGATTSDEDMLSSLAAEVKHVKKEKDLSLLRELKDFKASATEIEDELQGVYQQISKTSKPKDTKLPPAKNTN